MDGLAGKARDRANVGGTWAIRRDTLSKLRTVRKIERVSIEIFEKTIKNYTLYVIGQIFSPFFLKGPAIQISDGMFFLEISTSS